MPGALALLHSQHFLSARAQRPRQGRRQALAPCCQARQSGNNDDHSTAKEVAREVITFVTSDGLVRIPGRNRVVLRPNQHKQLVAPMPTWEEQQLCIGACFRVAATNGADASRRINIEGFCQSVDYLLASVQDSLESELGGEVLMEERQLKSGLHEMLRLTVAVPYLFGVPPQLEVLNEAIREGGGIVDRVRHEWLILPGYA